MEKDRQVAELKAELATTRHKHTLTELFLAFQVFVSLENFCGVRFDPFALPQIPVPVLVQQVFRICDILVRIRMRGSVPLTSRSGSGSCYFRQ
jgi:hypothetical protein